VIERDEAVRTANYPEILASALENLPRELS
jgi:hypothetical protein